MAGRARGVKVAVGLALGVTGLGAWKLYRVNQTEDDLSPTAHWPQRTPPQHLGKVLASWTTNFEPTIPWDNNWDRRDPKSLIKPPKVITDATQENYENELKAASPTAKRHIILIRHGQYNMVGNLDTDHSLTKLGCEQAEFTGVRLKDLEIPYTSMVHSTMTRATETANIIHKHILDVHMDVDDILKEGAPIPPEPPVGHWRPEKNKFFIDGARIEAAFRKYFHRAPPSQEKDSHLVLVCHANVIRYFVCRALQLPPEAWLRMSLHNGSITYICISPTGRVSLRCLGDAGFMPKDKLTFT